MTSEDGNENEVAPESQLVNQLRAAANAAFRPDEAALLRKAANALVLVREAASKALSEIAERRLEAENIIAAEESGATEGEDSDHYTYGMVEGLKVGDTVLLALLETINGLK